MPERPRLAIDWGKARIGVALSAAHTSFAYPLATVKAGKDEVRSLLGYVAEHHPEVIYVGFPINLRGEHGPAAEFVLAKARILQEALGDIPVRMVDERLSTAAASRNLEASGRNTKAQRSVIDQAAAVEILSRALEIESRTGAFAGETLDGS